MSPLTTLRPASFLANGGAIFAFAIGAAKLGLMTSARGMKAMYSVAGRGCGTSDATKWLIDRLPISTPCAGYSAFLADFVKA